MGAQADNAEKTAEEVFIETVCIAKEQENQKDNATRVVYLNKNHGKPDFMSKVKTFKKKFDTENKRGLDLKAKLEEGEQATRDFWEANLECYKHVRQGSKNPHLVLAFCCKNSSLNLGGFPPLMREIAEIVETGELSKLCTATYVEAIERYANIEQRWGR